MAKKTQKVEDLTNKTIIIHRRPAFSEVMEGLAYMESFLGIVEEQETDTGVIQKFRELTPQEAEAHDQAQQQANDAAEKE